MTALSRDQVPELVSRALGGKPVRWASPGSSIGDYDGRDATLDVFDAPARDQLALLRGLRPIRDAIDAAADAAIVFVFHTPPRPSACIRTSGPVERVCRPAPEHRSHGA